MRLLVINGPNLNMLGIREKHLYGADTYETLERLIEETAARLQIEAEIFQSNHEGALVDKIQEAYGKADGIIINPAAYTHTSIAILDALKAVSIPACEVHITDVTKRESFRRLSYVGLACEAHFIGLGLQGYVQAMEYLAGKYNK